MKIGTATRRLAFALVCSAVLVPIGLSAGIVRQAGVTNGTQRTGDLSGRVYEEKTQKKKSVEMPWARVTPRKKASGRFIDGNDLSVIRKKRLNAEFPSLQSRAALFGSIVYASDWPVYGNKPYGLYRFGLTDGSAESVWLDTKFDGASGAYADGIYYSCSIYTGLEISLISAIDVTTGSTLNSVNKGGDRTAYIMNMSYDVTHEKLYAVTLDETGEGYLLQMLDRETLELTPVAPLNRNYPAFAATPLGLYGIGEDGILYAVDHRTGIASPVGNTGFIPVNSQSATWSPTDQKILWAAFNDTESHILAVDPVTVAVQKVCTLQNQYEVVGLYCTDSYFLPGAPSACTGLTLHYDTAGALEAVFGFTLPVTTVNGDPLGSEELQAIVKIDGEEVKVLQGEKGAVLLCPLTFTEGLHKISVLCRNAEGSGVPAVSTTYSGYDAPAPVSGLTASVTASGVVMAAWQAPVTGANGGYLDTSALTYKVERNGQTVAEGLTDTFYTEQLSPVMNTYVYTVTAFAGDRQGVPANALSFFFGDRCVLPYAESFDDVSSLARYTVTDANGDGSTWEYDDTEHCLHYKYHNVNDADDWAVTPAIEMPGDYMIELSFDAWCRTSTYPEEIEVTLGSSGDPLSQTRILLARTTIDNSLPQTWKISFTVPEGRYTVGFHATSGANNYYLYVDNVRLEAGVRRQVPGPVSELTAIPAPEGAPGATLAFKAPSADTGGDELDGMVDILVCNAQGMLLGTLTGLAPGESGQYVYTDEAAGGLTLFNVVAVNEFGAGDTVEVSCFIGKDIPAKVDNFRIRASGDNMQALLSWEAPAVGESGGYVDPGQLVYIVYEYKEGRGVIPIDEVTDPAYTVRAPDSTLTAYQYGVAAKWSEGEGAIAGGLAVLGRPYSTPFRETWAGAVLSTSPWMLYRLVGTDGGWVVAEGPELGIQSIDGGMLTAYSNAEEEYTLTRLAVPKISLAGCTQPVLKFSLYRFAEADGTLSIKISDDDETFDEIFDQEIAASKAGWTDYEIDLSPYKDRPWITLALDAGLNDVYSFVCIEELIVKQALDYDVTVRQFTGPESVIAGQEAVFTATVLNDGARPVTYDVVFSVDGEILTTRNETVPVKKGESRLYTASFTPVAEHIGHTPAIRVTVVPVGYTDQDPENDSRSVSVSVKQPDLPVITDLQGDLTDEGVRLTWSDPVVWPDPVCDGFESYQSFIIDQIGDYTVIDRDTLRPYEIDGVEFDNYDIPKAFQVWEPGVIYGISSQGWFPYSGDKCLIAFSGTPKDEVLHNDDWLILPEITGGTPLSFYASEPTSDYGNEQFEVLYSSATDRVEDFARIAEVTLPGVGWKQYAYDLPADAKYVAIRYISRSCFALLIDDLTYTPARTFIPRWIGYNIYRNGQKLNEMPSNMPEYTDRTLAGLSGTFRYYVTNSYAEGESARSNLVEVTTGTGLDRTVLSAIKIYGGEKTLLIENAENQRISVYAPDGRLYMEFIPDNLRVSVSVTPGVYVVKTDDRTVRKVVVR